jgi:hypothetical protein
MRCLTVAFLLVSVLAMVPSVARGGCVSYGDYLHPLDALEPHEDPLGFWMITGEMPQLYVVTFGGWFSVVDASDPAALDELGSLNFAVRPWGMVAQSGIVYLTLTPTTLQLVDVSDPQSPTPRGSVTMPSEVHGLAVSGSYAFVTAYRYGHDDHGVYVVDVADPDAPFVVTRVDVGSNPENILIDGPYAYVLRSSQLCVLDITDPAAPFVAARLGLPGAPQYVACREGYVYVVCHASDEDGDRWYGDGLYIVNAIDPVHPWLEGVYAPEEDAPNAGIALWSHYAIAGNPGHGIEFIDISNPASPISVQQIGIQNPGDLWGFLATDTALYAIAGCLMSYHLEDAFTPDPVATVPGTEGCRCLAARNGFAYTGDLNGDFHIVEMTDPAAPQLTSTLPLPLEWIGVVAVTEDPGSPPHAYVAGLAESHAFAVVDVTDPHQPRLVRMVELIHDASDLEVEGNRLYVQAGHAGTRIYDITEPSAPVFVGDIDFTFSPQFLTAAGTTLYVGRRNIGDHEDLYIIDVRDGSKPLILSTSRAPELPYEIRVVGTLAYIADGDGGLLIMDVSDPTDPIVLSRLRTPRCAASVWVDGELAYVADQEENAGLQVVDVSDPTAPFTIGYFQVDRANDLQLIHGHLLVASWWDPLVVAPLDCSAAQVGGDTDRGAASVRLAWSVNPARRGGTLVVNLPRAGRLRLTLHDAQGRLVQRLHDGELGSGDHAFRWDGRDAAGRRVMDGVYFARLGFLGVERSRAFVLLR